MKLLVLTIATLISCSLGGGTYSPFALESALILTDPISQDAQQTKQQSAEISAKIANLSSPNPVERAEAACRIGELKATAAIPSLLKILGDDIEIQQPVCGERHKWGDDKISQTTPGEMAAVALSRMGQAAVEPLTLAMKGDVWQSRANAAFALGLVRDTRSVEPLIAATSDQAWQVRSRSVWALGLVGDQRAVEALNVALKDSDAHVRSQAAWALGLTGDRRAVEPLQVALKDQDEHVRKQAAWALKLRGPQNH